MQDVMYGPQIALILTIGKHLDNEAVICITLSRWPHDSE